MSDFADGVAPLRYSCRRSHRTSRSRREPCARASSESVGNTSKKPLYWSLDEGRWILNEPKDSHKRTDVKTAKESNGFVKFKRLVDSGFDALNFAKRRHEINEVQQRSEQDAWMRWTGQQGGPDSRPPAQPRSDAVKATRYLLQIADLLTRDAKTPSTKIQLLFQDDREDTKSVRSREDPWLAAGGAWYFMPEVGDKLPLAASLVRRPPPPPPRWLTIDWFKCSPYSPIQVEAIEDLPGPRERWRAAFEDLILASLDRSIYSDPMTESHALLFPGIDWVLSLQTRSILPPLLPSLYCPKTSRNVQTNMIGNPYLRQHDYREFSNLVDEIWISNRSSLNDYWLSQLQILSK